MKITHHTVTVRELTEGYEDNEEAGVTGYNGQRGMYVDAEALSDDYTDYSMRKGEMGLIL